GAEGELVGERVDRAVDHRGVEAEQEPADGGGDRDPDDLRVQMLGGCAARTGSWLTGGHGGNASSPRASVRTPYPLPGRWGAGTGQTVRCAGGGARAGPCSLLRGGLEPLELLLRDRRIELDEDRGGLGDRLAGCDRSVLPGGDVGVVDGDDRVAR